MTDDERYDGIILERIKNLEKDVKSLRDWRIAVVALAVPTAFGSGTLAHGLWQMSYWRTNDHPW